MDSMAARTPGTRCRSRVRAVAAALAGGLLLSACNGAGPSAPPPTQSRPQAPAPTPAPAGSASAVEPYGGPFQQPAVHETFQSPALPGWAPEVTGIAGRQNSDIPQAERLGVLQPGPDPAGTASGSASASASSRVLKVTLPNTKYYRSEIAQPPVQMGSEYWYGFRVFIPKDWRQDPQGNILAQWHGLNGLTQEPGAKYNPPLALDVVGDQWLAEVHWNSLGIDSAPKAPGAGSKSYLLGTITPGTWTDFVVHAKWSFGADGFVQVLMNGKQSMSHTGPDCYREAAAPYFKMGIYHPDRKNDAGGPAGDTVTEPVTVYDGDITIKQAPASYAYVAPH